MRPRHPACPSFISYARPDESFARALVAHLEAKGADVWWDLNSITLGTPLSAALRSAVGESRYLLLIATPSAAQSAYVRLEVETAISQQLRIVPICLNGQVPPELQSLLSSAPELVEPMISALEPERASALDSALRRLERSPAEQLRWIQLQAPYQNLRNNLARARANMA